MALRNDVEKHVLGFDINKLFDLKGMTPDDLLNKLKTKIELIFGQYIHLLEQSPGSSWVENLWNTGFEHGYTFKSPSRELTVLDCDKLVTEFIPSDPSKIEPIYYLFRKGDGYRWDINSRFAHSGGGIRSVINCTTSKIPDDPATIGTFWSNLSSGIQKIGTYSISLGDAHTFYNNSGWTNYADLSVIFHLVYPQFFPVFYLRTKDGYSQEDGISRLLDDISGLLRIPRNPLNLKCYEDYSRSYRLLLLLFDYWVKKNTKQIPHFDYFTQFLASLNDSAANNKDILLLKRSLVLYGIPGTGKTHTAKAISIDIALENHVKLIQFHPNYSYQDFVIGIRIVVPKIRTIV